MPENSVNLSSDFESYERWLAEGRSLAQQTNDSHWAIGDWLDAGAAAFEGLFDFKSDRHLLLQKKGPDGEFKSATVPHFWKDAAAETGFAVSWLYDLRQCARAFAPHERFKQLSFSHHLYAMRYERRLEYLGACFVDGGRPRSVTWLEEYINRCEAKQDELGQARSNFRFVRFAISEEMRVKLTQLSKYRKTNVSDLVQKHCTAALEEFLRVEAQKVALELHAFYKDGEWPLATSAVRAKGKHRRRTNFRSERGVVSIRRLARGNRVA